jgi:hypothetical protein
MRMKGKHPSNPGRNVNNNSLEGRKKRRQGERQEKKERKKEKGKR